MISVARIFPWRRHQVKCNELERARAAKRSADVKLRKAIQQQEEVEMVVEEAKELREINHFGESIERAFRRQE